MEKLFPLHRGPGMIQSRARRDRSGSPGIYATTVVASRHMAQRPSPMRIGAPARRSVSIRLTDGFVREGLPQTAKTVRPVSSLQEQQQLVGHSDGSAFTR